jgi:hypothetical protein
MRRGDVVFVSFYWPVHPAADYHYAIERLTAMSSAARSVGARFVIQAPIPRFAEPGYMCMPEWFRRGVTGCEIARDTFEQRRANAMNVIHNLQAEQQDIYVWDPINLICQPACRTFADGRPVFRDYTHFSYAQAVTMGPDMRRFLDSLAVSTDRYDGAITAQSGGTY